MDNGMLQSRRAGDSIWADSGPVPPDILGDPGSCPVCAFPALRLNFHEGPPDTYL